MALQVATVPNPATGHDWTYVVPGQYVETIVGVQATFTNAFGNGAGAAIDSSGNGRNGSYVQSPTGLVPIFVTGALTNGTGIKIGDSTPPTAPATRVAASLTSPTFAASWTLAWFQRRTVQNDPNAGSFLDFSPGQREIRVMTQTRINTLTVDSTHGTTWSTAAGLVADDNWHHFALVWNTATLVLYLDGVAQVWAVTGSYTGGASAPNIVWLGSVSGNLDSNGYLDNFAYFPSALSAANITTLFTAATTEANYLASVLTFSPAWYYQFDDAPTAINRNVLLNVTDGSNSLMSIPAPSLAVKQGTVYTWSWQAGLNSSSISADGLVASISLPSITLQPGWTIGTFTPDLQTNDSWSNINIWYQDTSTTPGPGGGLGQVQFQNTLLLPASWYASAPPVGP